MNSLQGHKNWVRIVAYGPDGLSLASGGLDTAARLWDLESRSLLHTLDGHQGWVRGLAFSPDARVLASGSLDDIVRL